MNYKIYLLNFSNYSNKNNLNLHQILSTTEIFPISWGELDEGGLDKGFYGNTVFGSVNPNPQCCDIFTTTQTGWLIRYVDKKMEYM